MAGAAARFGGILTQLNIDEASSNSYNFFCGGTVWALGVVGEAITDPKSDTLTIANVAIVAGFGGIILPLGRYLLRRGKQLNVHENSYLLHSLILMVTVQQYHVIDRLRRTVRQFSSSPRHCYCSGCFRFIDNEMIIQLLLLL